LSKSCLEIKEGKNIAIISEAGCPGIADPGQILIELAQQLNARAVLDELRKELAAKAP
jgi:16S rRNA C1402 (ribose-2'-O) methylase RsmI